MQTRLPYWLSGILFLFCGGGFVVATLLVDHWLLWALGTASGLFGVVRIVQDRMVRGRVDFTPEELEKWGERLSAGTPRIVTMLESGETPKAVAVALEKERGIPQEICLRFIIALGQHGQ